MVIYLYNAPLKITIMTNKKPLIALAIVIVAAAAAATWWATHRATADKPEEAPEPVSALVKTQPIGQQKLDTSLVAFGDVQSGKTDTLSFPQPGQLTQLAVLAGQQVHRGDTLAVVSTDPSANAGYVQAASAATFARAELQRTEEMFTLKLVTQTQLETARKQLQDAESALAAQQQLGTGRATASLIAPVDGVVTALTAAQGDRLAAGAPVLSLGETGTLRIQFGIEPGQRRLVKTGMKVSIALVQDASQTIEARVSEIQNVIDPKSQLVNAIVKLPANAALVAGMHVQGTIHLGDQEAWLAPRQAVLSDDKGAYIFQVEAGKAHRVEVTKINETATHFAIDGKIDPKLPLVVLGNYELEDEMAVRESGK